MSRSLVVWLLGALVVLALPSPTSSRATPTPHPPLQQPSRSDDEPERPPPSTLAETFATFGNLVPRFTFTAKPETLLKLRKVFRPLMTELVVGGDYDPQHNIWTFRTEWTENLLGGNLALLGPNLQWSKALFFPGIADVATRVKFLASLDLRTFEPRTGMEIALRRASVFQRGIELERKVPLDGPNGHFKLGLVGSVEFPESIGVSTSSAGFNASEVKIGVHLKRVDLLLDF
jgi:hypothetical protein